MCGHCSKNKFLIPNQSSKPVRVCNACYEKLGKLRTSLNLKDSPLNNSGHKAMDKSVNTNVKTIQVTESSESEDEEENRHKQTDDDLTQSLEDLTIDEKVAIDLKFTVINTSIISFQPTFYSTISGEVKDFNA